MRSLMSRRPSPALVLAFVALLAALSGTAVALPGKNGVKKDDLAAGSVGKRAIAKNGVGASEVGKHSIGPSELKTGGVTGEDVDEGSLGQVPRAATAGSADRATSAQSAATATSATRAGSVAQGGVTSGALAAKSVTASKLADVTLREVDGTVGAGGTGLISAPCQPGEAALSGGGVWGGTINAALASQLHIVHSFPPNKGEWRVRVFNGSGATQSFTVMVLCLAG